MNYLIEKNLKWIKERTNLSQDDLGIVMIGLGSIATESVAIYSKNKELFTFNEKEKYMYDWDVENTEEIECCEKCNKPKQMIHSKANSCGYYVCICNWDSSKITRL